MEQPILRGRTSKGDWGETHEGGEKSGECSALGSLIKKAFAEGESD